MYEDSQHDMARILFNQSLGIESMSGTIAKSRSGKRIIVTTRRKPSNPKCKMHLYIRDKYERTKPLSDAETAARVLFSKRAAYVKQLMLEHKCRTRAEAWQIAKKDIV